MKAHRFRIIVILAATAILLTGCSSEQSNPSSGLAQEQSDQFHVPHTMAGETAQVLQGLLTLPSEGEPFEVNIRAQLEHSIQVSKSNTHFSVLSLVRFQELVGFNQTGIGQSWRTDITRPDTLHVSQALWDWEEKEYLLNEWIVLEGDVYLNSGIWSKLADDPSNAYYLDFGKTILPESQLSRMLASGIEISKLVDLDGQEYIYFLSKPIWYPESDAHETLQVWIDRQSGLLHKYQSRFVESDTWLAEITEVYQAQEKVTPITEPPCVNIDYQTDEVDFDKVCRSRHW